MQFFLKKKVLAIFNDLSHKLIELDNRGHFARFGPSRGFSTKIKGYRIFHSRANVKEVLHELPIY